MKILHLEDNPADAELTRTQLEGYRSGTTLRVVASREDFVQELKTGDYDLVLSDYSLPGFAGLDALGISREVRPDMPFIFLSGSIGEDGAIAALQAGAADYIIKDRMKRLGAAVERAVQDFRDRRARQQAEKLVRGQNRVLELLALGTPLSVTLDALLRVIEDIAPELYCSILLLDRDGQHMRHCAAPRLPEAYLRSIDGFAIGPQVGTCGTAMYLKREVITEDIATDPNWDNYRHLAVPHGLRSCWSTPFLDAEQQALGTFAVYRRKPGQPTPKQQHLIHSAIHLATLCVIRYHAEQLIRDQAEVIRKAPIAIVIADLDGHITYWNDGATRIYGWTPEETVGQAARQVLRAEVLSLLGPESLEAQPGGEWKGEMPLANKAGEPLHVEFSVSIIRDQVGRPKARLSISTDITEEKLLREQFLRSQRMENLGMLAAGIAHDFNNILTPMLMIAPLLREYMQTDRHLRLLETVENSAARGAALVKQILSFAHGTGGEPMLLQPKHVVREVSSMIEETFPRSIRFEHEIPTDLAQVVANPTHLHQVLLNLCVNARDAMPNGGALQLNARNRTLSPAEAAGIRGGRAGNFVVFEIIDTGQGIPAEILNDIWEPFFTTKGKMGTGLGLSTVRGIIRQHDGFCEVQSQPGVGTTVRVYLPAAEESIVPDSGSNSPEIPRGNGELVLVVDDELDILEMATATLTHHGYRVLAARDGVEAVGLLTSRGDEVRLVITDVHMPNLSGEVLVSILGHLRPTLPVLVITGMTQPGAVNEEPTMSFGDGILLKPFKLDELLRAVHRLMSRSLSSPSA